MRYDLSTIPEVPAKQRRQIMSAVVEQSKPLDVHIAGPTVGGGFNVIAFRQDGGMPIHGNLDMEELRVLHKTLGEFLKGQPS